VNGKVAVVLVDLRTQRLESDLPFAGVDEHHDALNVMLREPFDSLEHSPELLGDVHLGHQSGKAMMMPSPPGSRMTLISTPPRTPST